MQIDAHPARPARPTASPQRFRRRVRSATIATGVVVALVAPALLPASSAAQEAPSVAAAEAKLDAARQVRVAAEARLADLESRRGALQSRLDVLDAATAQITTELAAARREVREYAVEAYIDGGQSEMLASTLQPAESAERAWRSQLIAGRTIDRAAAVERLDSLEKATDPERRAMAAEIDELGETIDAASGDALQAAALERDAEAAVASAREAEEERAEQERRAAQAARQQQAAARQQQEAARSQPASRAVQSGPSRPAAAPRGATPAPGAASVAGATEAEAAQLAKIRHCESRGNYGAVSASGRYRGAYQFDTRTWAAVGGSGDPAAASPAEQDARALQLLRARGTRPWPHCG